jgi:glycosyltransferase involved in cell wall biosynthesis
LLLKVHKKLIDEGLKHSVIILGDGEERENLKNQISEENLKETFHLLGTKCNPYPYIKNSDFFILPSQSEAYPLVINEALALQKPIISTNVGGIPEMIDDGKDGILVNFDENEIFEAMKKFLTEPELVKKITEGTLNADEKFDEKKIYQQVTEVFEQQYKKLIK